MDLGISGRKAIVCASSKGLGRAAAIALAEAGCTLALNGRDPETLAATAREIRARFGVTVDEIAGDLDDPATREALIAAAPEADILINNNGGPPFKAFGAITRGDILAGVEANMLTPIALVQALLPGMAARRFGRIVNITSGSVRAPLAGLDVSSGARAGLTAFLASAARGAVRDNVTINFLLPGAFATDRQRSAIARTAAERGVPFETAEADAAARSPARRFGDPAEFGALCAFLASAHAGFITGQNILIDGGAFPGTF
ncbi:3-oxoacyl-[acyl-carrier protein] reductase [Roseiarcus fermentans]|uniref:3-oxoacyl-[acyl-carrier protein] reductase n=1 Tax=Roseiarcus fermentans TaxID=1473586 RepID=A0A366FIB7_9HYPH|nr:SDR family oxidoreductase [Roseiarcus fermentans]RBP14414.1 3-oxoacyl-[acyl-carrier protein] reductase [Roseiarcus fermentans]